MIEPREPCSIYPLIALVKMRALGGVSGRAISSKSIYIYSNLPGVGSLG